MLNNTELNIYQKITLIFSFIQLVLCILGLIGNILAISVFSRSPLRRQSYSFYCRIMAYSDNVLLLYTFKNWSDLTLDANLELLSPFFCRFSEFVPHIAGYISHWMLALVSIDRLVVIVYPNRYKIFQKSWFQIALVSIVVLYAVLANVQMPLNYQLEIINQTLAVCYLPTEFQYNSSLLIMINAILVNLVLNNIIHVKIVSSIRASKKKVNRISHRRVRTTIRDRKFALNSIALNIASCLFKIPFAIGLYTSAYYNMSKDQHKMIYTITGALLIIDMGDLFYINAIVNSIFYREFRKMVRFKTVT